LLIQNGDANTSMNLQWGDLNTATVNQTGADQFHFGAQVGNGNTLTVTQSN